MGRSAIDQQITFLSVADIARTDKFYNQQLGLALALDQGGCRIYQVAEGAFIGACQRENLPEKKEGVVFTLVTEDVDGWHQHLVEQGIEVEQPPAENLTYNIYNMFFRDPDGYLLEIQRFLDPDWMQPAE
ncbi:MAG: VOC family protein [Chloroflexota bacterium]